jgi:hypothetical protein
LEILKRSRSELPISFWLKVATADENHDLICPKKYCRDCRLVSQHATTILEYLVGPDGSLCARWREIRLTNCNILQIPFFSYPTPLLERLILENVGYPDTYGDVLPWVPSLRDVSIVFCNLHKVPNFTNSVINLKVTISLRHQVGKILDDLPRMDKLQRLDVALQP